MHTPNPTLATRLWAKVDREGPRILRTRCWVWTGYICKQSGYGKIANRPGPPLGTHVAAYLITEGAVPEGLSVLHRCDNRPCVRHLYAGTQSDNVNDAVERGRHRPSGCRGSGVGTAVLTEATVAEVKRRLRAGEPGRWVGRDLNLSDSQVSKIKTGTSWRHIA